ncbi:hypothetical protein BJ170DRAFT_729928 [Xylariales sp. AK1849]|nr:hypothetical protein BJ170DRAFT_729928 [Xylariales sp. AK1849]
MPYTQPSIMKYLNLTGLIGLLVLVFTFAYAAPVDSKNSTTSTSSHSISIPSGVSLATLGGETGFYTTFTHTIPQDTLVHPSTKITKPGTTETLKWTETIPQLTVTMTGFQTVAKRTITDPRPTIHWPDHTSTSATPSSSSSAKPPSPTIPDTRIPTSTLTYTHTDFGSSWTSTVTLYYPTFTYTTTQTLPISEAGTGTLTVTEGGWGERDQQTPQVDAVESTFPTAQHPHVPGQIPSSKAPPKPSVTIPSPGPAFQTPHPLGAGLQPFISGITWTMTQRPHVSTIYTAPTASTDLYPHPTVTAAPEATLVKNGGPQRTCIAESLVNGPYYQYCIVAPDCCTETTIGIHTPTGKWSELDLTANPIVTWVTSAH